ncbi:MAG: hypothetical protein WKF70_13275 [Chitinophagaceae bacterium]
MNTARSQQKASRNAQSKSVVAGIHFSQDIPHPPEMKPYRGKVTHKFRDEFLAAIVASALMKLSE